MYLVYILSFHFHIWFLFPMAAKTNDHKLGDIEQHMNSLTVLGAKKCETGFNELKVVAGLVPGDSAGRASFPCISSFCTACVLWLVTRFSHHALFLPSHFSSVVKSLFAFPFHRRTPVITCRAHPHIPG